ncbi:probable E3 ubiquitin-protein ligase HECTD2 [Watersipora subatra]|uniref:probable E3 ubiquitin-protein ligase HECTD2 n=1 Tax=Watersipora subatra TaxID=2589382 RepID=UPI00355B1CAC
MGVDGLVAVDSTHVQVALDDGTKHSTGYLGLRLQLENKIVLKLQLEVTQCLMPAKKRTCNDSSEESEERLRKDRLRKAAAKALEKTAKNEILCTFQLPTIEPPEPYKEPHSDQITAEERQETMEGTSTATHPNGPVTKTCSSCKLSVAQPAGTKRTICPGCGAFYDAAVANHIREFQNGRLRNTQTDDLRTRYTQLHREKATKKSLKHETEEHSTSRPLQSIANFFQNIGPKKKGEKPEKGGDKELTLPDIDQNSNRVTAVVTSPRPPSTPRTASSYSRRSKVKERPPDKSWTSSELKHLYKTAKDTGEWAELTSIYSQMFKSFDNINATFKAPPEETGADKTSDELNIQLDLVDTVYEILKKAPSEIQKAVLKCVINCLLSDKGLSEKTRARVNVGNDELRVYLIFSLNPLFQNVTTYVILAHLLRHMASLSDHGHHTLVQWYSNVGVDQFKVLVLKLNKFISQRLFPVNPTDLPPMSKCHWWMPSCCKVLAILNATNTQSEPSMISYSDFYNETLNNIDLYKEYENWQNPEFKGGFSFCQYPFLLTISAKRLILRKDSEQQMISQARKTIVAQVQSRQAPELEALFLNLSVRRRRIVSDSLTEIAKNKFDLKKKLKVTFVGEPGLDLGGLTKEWFLLLVRDLFRPEYGMFVYDKSAGTYWFNLANRESKLKEYNLIGVLMGLAMYNGINLDIMLPFVAYKKLLSPAVVPCGNPNATVGVIPKPTVYDLESVMPGVAQSLRELLEYDGDVEDDFCLTHQVSVGQNGKTFTEELIKDGASVAVTAENRQTYVDAYLEWILNKSIYLPFRAFYHGFHSVCASNALLTLKPVEIEVLVCGCPDIQLDELQNVCQYDGYHERDQNIKDFWAILHKLNEKGQKSLLRFITGSDRIPAGGMQEMEFKISRMHNPNMLPVAHTCFNHLVLPAYNDKKVMQQKLLMAISNTEGFGLE